MNSLKKFRLERDSNPWRCTGLAQVMGSNPVQAWIFLSNVSFRVEKDRWSCYVECYGDKLENKLYYNDVTHPVVYFSSSDSDSDPDETDEKEDEPETSGGTVRILINQFHSQMLLSLIWVRTKNLTSYRPSSFSSLPPPPPKKKRKKTNKQNTTTTEMMMEKQCHFKGDASLIVVRHTNIWTRPFIWRWYLCEDIFSF